MSTISNTDLPGFDSVEFRRFMNCIQRDWNLPTNFQAHADFYFLRHWSAAQIRAMLLPDGILHCGLNFLPLFKRDSMEVYNKALDSDQGKMFWLSFRAVRYPLGSGSAHPWALKAYVLIQEDTRSI